MILVKKYDMLGFAALGFSSGPPVFCIFTPLESIFELRDPSRKKDHEILHTVDLITCLYDLMEPRYDQIYYFE